MDFDQGRKESGYENLMKINFTDFEFKFMKI